MDSPQTRTGGAQPRKPDGGTLMQKVVNRIIGLVLPLGLGVVSLLDKPSLMSPLTILVLVYFLFRFLHMCIRFPERQVSVKHKRSRKPPPTLLGIAVLPLPRDQRDAARGDIEEMFEKDVKAHGLAWAKLFMVRDILCSIFPNTRYFILRIVLRAVRTIGLYELIRRIIG